ncbi:MAG: PAS domain S-box protein [Desulfotignum sp.]|nr:PAS domain S-box protein [Desulfotignum sp.]MCF8126797.1 PAS domain S-box protein [Desulfotignum sp.]
MQNKTTEEKFDALRRQAEALMSNPDFSKRLVAFEDPLQLIHELQTFQVELELQNDELRLAQQELTEFKINYTQLYDFTPVGYVTLDAKGKILNANLTLARMLATEKSALINRPLSDHVLPRDQDIYYLHLQALFASEKRQVCDLKMKKKEGDLFDVQLESTVIPEPGQGKARYRTVIIDVSDRKHTERLLKYGRHQLESVLNRIESSVYVADMTSYEILFMNSYMKKKHNADLTGQICWAAIHGKQTGPCDICNNDRLMDEAGNPTEPCIWEFYNKGSDQWHELSSLAIPWTDGRMVRLEIARNITGRKQAEKKQKEMRLTLEEKVKQRTAELEDMNATLRILLKKRDEDKNEIKERIFANYKLILTPIILNLKKSLTRESQKNMMDILESELKNVLSPFSKKLSGQMVNLTPMEIHIADLVKFGKTNKEISEIMHSSIHTISRHRENIRKKIGLKNKKINLRSFLSTLE